MPDEPPRRIILEKSKTVKRRYQRSNQRFQFTASQIERLDREQEREKKAKQLREKEKKRIANKKRKAEQEARAREERKRRGLPDPNALVPSSQPLLSMFLGAGKRQSSAVLENKPKSASEPAPEPAPQPIPELAPESTTTETESHNVNMHGMNTDLGSEGGDTEPDSDAFDDLDEELEKELSLLQDAGVSNAGGPAELEVGSDAFDDMDGELENELPELPDAGILAETEGPAEPQGQGIGIEKPASDEFSDCSAFNDENIIKEAEAAIRKQTIGENTKKSSPFERSPLMQPPASHRPTVPTPPPPPPPPPQSSFYESFQFDPVDLLEAEAAIISQTNDDETKNQCSSKSVTIREPPVSDRPRNVPILASSVGDSFRDETADWIEEAFAHGSGDPFGGPNQISS
ncbi:uncharacterized protein N7515_007057 [Penicillium bovifimosum]|uniref:Uncharacterized protein n=1 Tax=Penicillium bovifimosum TaxID=126998 RepID=A0A9W9GW79_9EURO|nr:uncharacterized protein N7515_007057 [Penicillium bovifimosum]KAJ5131018.1 hypothetical protein N7515_007057 [Penicillium bovifimosum]